MFAVPGWSVSACTLRSQTTPSNAESVEKPKPDEANGVDRKSKKRKRGPGLSKITDVTEDNLCELWRKHIECESAGSLNGEIGWTAKLQKEKKKNEKDGVVEKAVDADGNENAFGGSSKQGTGHLGDTESSVQGERKNKGKEEKEEKEENEDSHIIQLNTELQIAEDPPNTEKAVEQKENGKVEYERRRAKAATKKQQRALLEADGSLPPKRAEATHVSTATIASSRLPKSKTTDTASQSASKAVDAPAPSEHIAAHASREPSHASKPLKPLKAPILPSPPPSAARLTPLQQRMAAKLTSARFRHLNQTLYTSPSDEAMRLFADSPQAYISYHAGFRAQVAVWPQNPVDGFIEDLKLRGKMGIQSQKSKFRETKKGKKAKAPFTEEDMAGSGGVGRQSDPLPRTRGACTIADLGCGDAHLAGSLQPLKQALNLNLRSFDLAKGNTPNAGLITVADISNLVAAGIRDGSVDVAICCLSLMGTNWVEVVGECARIVRDGGEVWVAEIKSRFVRPGQTKRKGDGIGKKKVKKSRVDEGDEDGELAALDDLDDTKAAKDETDVSEFVEVFRKRGLHLKGEPDMANKMFAKMRFHRTMRASTAKENEKGWKARLGEGLREKQVEKRKFLVEEAGAEMDENQVLKPCVYKTR
ncbi:hypothetical protein P7C71_g3470, partial [Lecanoromycetidae sp. Uapishka_2]